MSGKSRHGPNRLTNYLGTHETVMAQWAARGFLLVDGLEFGAFGGGYFVINGTLQCLGNIVVEVDKVLQVVDGDGSTARVQTVWYRYNARLPGKGVIVRCNAGPGALVDHRLPCHIMKEA